jgi:hypothetical protein
VGVKSEPIGAGLMPYRFVFWVVLSSAVEAEVYGDGVLSGGFIALVFLFAVSANNAFSVFIGEKNPAYDAVHFCSLLQSCILTGFHATACSCASR